MTKTHAKLISATSPSLPNAEAWAEATTKPRKGRKVMVCGLYRSGHRFRAMARWYPAGTLDASQWEDPPAEWWDDSGHRCLCPDAAWWECSVQLEDMTTLDNVTHWRELPEMPPHPFPQNDEMTSPRPTPSHD